jgi:predicted ATPase
MSSKLFVYSVEVTGEIPEDNYIAKLPTVRNLRAMGGLAFHKPVTFLVGENGVGKSTLIEAIAIHAGFNAEGGSRNFNFSTHESHSDLYHYIRLTRGPERNVDGFFLRAESFYNVASNIDDLDRHYGGNRMLIESYGGKSLHEQSHGESFLSLVEHRFNGYGLYILDEPEAALSPMKLMTLMCLIRNVVDEKSQFIISTHSPILMTFPGAEIYELTEKGIRSVRYQETEHFQVTKQFLNAPEQMLRYLDIDDLPER